MMAAFHRCHLNRSRMMHVVNNIAAYLMFEVLETAWLRLEETLQTSTSIDDVIVAHDAYLKEILDKALLSPQHETLNMKLQELLQIILRFCNLEETLLAGEWF
jgi:gamma-tubulin complex component 3